MLSKNAKLMLAELKKSDNKSIEYHVMAERYSWDFRAVKSACYQLINDDLATEYMHSTMPGQSKPWGIVLSEKGRNTAKYFWAEIGAFLMKSILTPIIVTIITALITLWLNGQLC